MTDPILRADAYEEQCAHDALRATTNTAELASVWWRDCDHWPEGPARDRLRETYSDMLGKFSPLARAG